MKTVYPRDDEYAQGVCPVRELLRGGGLRGVGGARGSPLLRHVLPLRRVVLGEGSDGAQASGLEVGRPIGAALLAGEVQDQGGDGEDEMFTYDEPDDE